MHMLPASRLLGIVAPAACALLLVAGCAGSNPYSVTTTDIARAFLPTERELAHHPDSLAHLSVVPKDGRITFELEESYQQMMREWSATWQGTRLGGAASQRTYYHTYATLWSLELSLVSLQPGRGLQSLSLDLARRLIEERREAYQSTVQIDVYRFMRSPYTSRSLSALQIDSPGNRIVLEDGAGNTYRPTRVETGRPNQAYLPGGGTALYGRNAVYFRRMVDGKDILENVETLELTVSEPGGIDYTFSWIFPEADF